MNSFKISWLLFKNNLKLYRFYLTVLTLTTAIYYNFLAVNYNPYLQVLGEQYIFAQAASSLCSIILLLTVMSFMFHANNFFYKLRYKEIGTYMLMGIPGNKIGAVFALESILLGGTAVITGLPIGLLFSKLFFMLLGNAMILNIQIPFYIPHKAVGMLLLIFAFIILLMGIKNYLRVRRSRLIEILNVSKKEQQLPKIRWIRGITGMACITAAYYISLNIFDLPFDLRMDFFQATVLVLILICIGTYLFFGSFLAIVLNALIQKKKVIYKRSRLVSFSNTLFSMGTNYRSFSMTAILCASTLAAFSGSLALKYFADTNTAVEAPYSISYFDQDEATNKKIRELIQESSHQILAEHASNFLIGNVSYNYVYGERTGTCLITSISEVKKSLMITRPKDYQQILKTIELRDNETVKILHSNLVFSGISYVGQDFVMEGRSYVLKKEVKLPFIGQLGGIGKYDTYIVTDKQYSELKENGKEMTLYGINITQPEDSIELVGKIAGVMKNPGENLNSYAGQYQYKYYLIGAFYFMGLVMSIVFVISTFSTMYFKILSDAILDREQYRILMKIGMTEQEVAKSIYTQVGIAFILPVLLGIIHGVMAIKALESFIHYQFTGSIITGVVVLILVMAGFYLFISKRYRNMVVKGWNIYETA
ncbi:ABC transporter permease protein YxdM [Oxobacter pfennigii]|uniref:ABC transporter permease protein YxdM n=1 Tax=Oxobacter pfennigii TaxID=36849 RepID=A0A0P8W6U7_9CLOT|nr:ABC transporter permease [Oxobacter pfennigii]KPU43510.1 ABC transporter permease protein YxdM [Oxobacter pfennigii]